MVSKVLQVCKEMNTRNITVLSAFMVLLLMLCTACGDGSGAIASSSDGQSSDGFSTSVFETSDTMDGFISNTTDVSDTSNTSNVSTTGGISLNGTSENNTTTNKTDGYNKTTVNTVNSKTTGTSKTNSVNKTTATTQSSSSNNKIVPAQHVLKTYITDNSITKAQFLSSVAYMEEGVIKDTLFQAFVFTPTPSFMYDSNGKRAMNKEDWLSYINDHTFKAGKNMDTLEQAMESVKTTLGLKDYKVQVYLSLLYPVHKVTSFGEVNGKNLDFSKEADRLEAVKWLMDEQLRVFKSKNYKNIEVVGFFWFTEEVEMAKDAALIKSVTDYIRSSGYISMWSPYFHAQGFDQNDKLGFDRVTMQPNYYPDSPNVPNNGPIGRLAQAAYYTTTLNIGVEMEIASSRPASVKGLKEYMVAGLERGFADKIHVWYLNSGPSQVYSLYHSRDAYVVSGYSDIYKYVKGKLNASEVILDF